MNWFRVGDKVDLLRTIDDSERFYGGEIIGVDGGDYPYLVELDHDGRRHWFKEDDLELVPTPEQIKQFADLVDRVLGGMQGQP